jgi:hypothetical protein
MFYLSIHFILLIEIEMDQLPSFVTKVHDGYVYIREAENPQLFSFINSTNKGSLYKILRIFQYHTPSNPKA